MYRCWIILLTLICLIAASGCDRNPVSSVDSPNIILVSIDTLRADRAGERPVKPTVMPAVERLATGGAFFEYAIAPIGTTWPSHATMLTGLYPRYHGLRSNGHTLPKEVPVISELLSSAGYVTGSFISFKGMHYVGGLGRGFETVSDPDRPSGDVDAIRDGRETMDMALEWLRGLETADDPVFLWLHLFEPHNPYEVTEYSRQWMEETGYSGLLKDGADQDLLQSQTKKIVETPSELEALHTLYDGEAELADQYFDELLEALDDLGRIDNSIVIFTSDHGESLGENGRIGHGPVLRQELFHVPLVIRDFRTDGESRRIEQAVGLVDIAPTIARLALDLALPNVQGRSLIPLIYGNRDADSEAGDTPAYFAEVALRTPDQVGDWYDRDAVAVYSQGLEFILHRDEPMEVVLPMHNAQPDSEGSARAEVDDALKAYIEDLVDEFLAGEVQPVKADLEQSDIEALRALGYLQ